MPAIPATNHRAQPCTIPVAIYTRVSTLGQVGGRFDSCESQAAIGRDFIAKHAAEGWFEAASYSDPAYSGGTMKRPGMEALMRHIAQGGIRVVVIFKLERVLRSTAEWAPFRAFLRQHRCRLESPMENLTEETAMDRFHNNLRVNLAEFERENTGDKVRAKMIAQVREGIWNCGQVPYGYDYDLKSKALSPHPIEAPIIRRIYEEAARLVSLTSLANTLNDEGLRTRTRLFQRRDGRRETVGGKRFRSDKLRQIIRSPIYLGRVHLHGEDYPGHHEPLVSQSLWDRANAAVAKPLPARCTLQARDKHFHLLKGLIHCGHCARAMTPNASGRLDGNGRPYRYYTCGHAHKDGNDVLGIQFAVPIGRMCPARPRGEEQFSRRRRQRTFEVLGAVHRMHCRLNRREFLTQRLPGRRPDPDQIRDITRPDESTREIFNLLLLLAECDQQRMPARLGVFAGEPLNGALLPLHLRARGARSDIDRDPIVEEWQPRQVSDNSRPRPLRPTGECEHCVMLAVEDKAPVGLCNAVAEPALFLDRQAAIQHPIAPRIGTTSQTRIQKIADELGVLTVVHGMNDRFPVKNRPERGRELIELGPQFPQNGRVMAAQSGPRSQISGVGGDFDAEKHRQAFPPQLPRLHSLPIAGESLVPHSPHRGFGHRLRILVISGELTPIVGIARPLHLQASPGTQQGEECPDLVLKRIQPRNRCAPQVRRLHPESAGGDGSPFHRTEENKILAENPVGGPVVRFHDRPS